MIKALEEKNDGRFDYSGSEEPLWAKIDTIGESHDERNQMAVLGCGVIAK